MASGNVTNLEVKVSLLHLLHTAYLRDGNPSEAQNALERILAVAPNNFKAILKCAEVLKQLDQNTLIYLVGNGGKLAVFLHTL